MRIKLAFLLGPLVPVSLIVGFMFILDRNRGVLKIVPVALMLSYAWFSVTGGIIYVLLRKFGRDNLVICALAGGVAGALYFIGPFAFSGYPISSIEDGTLLFVGLLFVVGAVAGICFRWISGPFRTGRPVTNVPNQSSEPTLSLVTPPAGQESRPR